MGWGGGRGWRAQQCLDREEELYNAVPRVLDVMGAGQRGDLGSEVTQSDLVCKMI